MKSYLDIILREHSTSGNLNIILKNSDESSSTNYILHDDGNVYLHNDSGVTKFCSAKNLAKAMSNVHYRNFDYLFNEGCERIAAVRCKTCKTVIFVDSRNEALYHVLCPTCAPTEQTNTFWTEEDIQHDSMKREYIRNLEKYSRIHKRIAQRYSKTHLTDSEIARWQWFGFKDTRHIYFSLRCDGLVRYGLRGLHLSIQNFRFNKTGEVLRTKSNTIIPMSPRAVYRYWILPHTRKFQQAMQSFAMMR